MRVIAPRSTRAASSSLQEKIAFLADPAHYPNHPRAVQTLETHFAWIFFAGERVYKLKKPLCQSSMDYRTVPLRERACRMEFVLNRRLAPDVYQRVVALRRTRPGGLSLYGGAQGIVDWLVQMRRLPAARMLDRAIDERAVRVGDLDRVVALLVQFFRRATPLPMPDRAYRARVGRQVRRVARELQAPDLAVGTARVNRVTRLQLKWLAQYPEFLTGRGARVCDGHGDLRPEHVFLGTSRHSACVIDCLEFDPRLRRLDPADEMAFLALECTRLGAARLARNVIDLYRQEMRDAVPPALMAFYMSRRAAVRAQIAAWHLRDPQFAGQASQWVACANAYLDDAFRHIHRARELARTQSKRHRPSVRPNTRGHRTRHN